MAASINLLEESSHALTVLFRSNPVGAALINVARQNVEARQEEVAIRGQFSTCADMIEQLQSKFKDLDTNPEDIVTLSNEIHKLIKDVRKEATLKFRKNVALKARGKKLETTFDKTLDTGAKARFCKGMQRPSRIASRTKKVSMMWGICMSSYQVSRFPCYQWKACCPKMLRQ